MGIGEILVVVIIGIVLYALFSMRKKPDGSGGQPNSQSSAGQKPGNDGTGNPVNNGGQRKSGYAK